MMRSRRSERRKIGIPEITLTPLIDTALTLLIIFIVASPMMHNAIKVKLPEGKAQEAAGIAEETVIHIDKKQHLYINGQPIKKDGMIAALKNQVTKSSNKTVFVNADEQVPYGFVMKMVDDIKVVGGISYVALATEKKA